MRNAKQTLVVVGDLAAMHDIGVWFTLTQLKIDLIVLIINNGGGGIFSFLPIAKQPDIFEQFFATAHDHSISPITQSMGIPTHSPRSITELSLTIRNAFQQGGLHCIEVHTDRHQHLLEHKELSSTIHSFLLEEES